MTKEEEKKDARDKNIEKREKPKLKPGSRNKQAEQEKQAAACLVDAEIDFETMTSEERRHHIQKLVANSDFAGFAPEMQNLFLAATKKLNLGNKERAPQTEWGLSTADAERCLTDIVRTEKFRQALKETIKAGDTVVEANANTGDTIVEAGAGTGILAMMAAAIGARKVYAVEINPQTVKTCRAFLEYCGFDQNVVEVIEGDATKCDLPEQADIIVSENMYTGLFAEPQMQIINNLRRFLKPGGKIIPEKFSSYLELVEAPGLTEKSVVRNEARILLKPATTRAQFDVVNFGRDEEVSRQGIVIIRATDDATIEAINVSSVIDLTSQTRINSNTCDFLGQDELVRLATPMLLKAGELYQVEIEYAAGCKPKDIKIKIEPAKKLRLDAAVPEKIKKDEDKKRVEFEANLAAIESNILDVDPDLIPPDDEQLKKILSRIEATSESLRQAKVSGLFELFELSNFYDRLEKLFGQFGRLPLGYVEGIEERMKKVAEILELEKKQREIEAIFDDTIESISDLNPADEDIDLEKIKKDAPICAAKIMKSAKVLFDYKVGGTFRIDEFYTYVEKLQIYHAALKKIIVGQNIEIGEEFEQLMINLQRELNRHTENLRGVPELLTGNVKDIMNFDEYNELSIKMTDLYVQYLKAREGNNNAIVNKKEKPADLNKYVSCQEATAKDGRRLMIEFKGRKGCEFGRCSNCCFATENATNEKVKTSHISKQFETALRDSSLSVEKSEDGRLQWAGDKKDIYKFDILTPGSFLNDNEMPKNARTEIFKKLAGLPFTQIMFESRIEYLDEAEIIRLKGLLRPDQKLQVAIGLETANNIIREVIINKGYTLSEFEKAIEMLAANGVGVQAYSIIKPALLSEKQAQEDSIKTAQYLADLAEKTREKTNRDNFEMTFKLEQAFIQDGGFLDFLHRQGKYETPWTFTTAEIVKKLCDDGLDKKLNIQIGTSHDYPPPTTAAQNRKSDGKYCPSTEQVDGALQEFNINNDNARFKKRLLEIQKQYPETFASWQALE